MRVLLVCVRRLLLLCVAGFAVTLVSCSSNGVMQVRQFHLKSVDPEGMKDAAMVRGEQMYRLRGAVSMEEHRQRLGQYYTVRWNNDGSHAGPLSIAFEYRQAATGSEILRMSRDLPLSETSGQVEFAVNGEAYRTGGRVLAWRIRMFSGDKVIAEKKSYLWR